MEKNLVLKLSSLVTLQSFSVFPEYFLGISIIYVLIVVILITYNVYNLMLQKAISESIGLILIMTILLTLNDDLLSSVYFLNFNNSIINDYFSFFAKLLVCFFSFLYFSVIANFLKEQKLISFEYLLTVLFSVLGLLLMCSSNDLLIAYLAMELSSLAFYVLAAFKKTSSYSIESGIKYFVTGAVASAFFLLGSSFIYGVSGSINFLDLQSLFECSYVYFDPHRLFYSNYAEFLVGDTNKLFSHSFLEFGLMLIIFSLFIKLALAPFHLWSLDVYEGSPTHSTFFFAVITKLSVFVLLIRLCYQSFSNIKECWQFYSVWVGAFSIFVGSFGGLMQRKLKTLLAYSSVSHMGYMLIAFSTSTFAGINMLLFYKVIYMISGLAVWYIVLVLRLKRQNFEHKYSKDLSDLALLSKANPGLAFSLAIIMFSTAGIPPLVGFLAKMSVFLSVVGISFYFIALVTILCSVVSTFYYIRIIKVLYFENLSAGKLYYPIETEKTIVLSVLTFLLLFLFVNPGFLYLINYKVFLCLF